MEFSAENWEKAKDLFDRALELDPAQRSGFLAENCSDDMLRQQIEQLLFNYQEAGSLLDSPVFDLPVSEGSGTSSASQDPIHLAETINTTESDDPLIGRQLGAYKLVRRIGRGGMAAVYLAERADAEFHKQVAVKVVEPGLDRQDLPNRFRNERQTLAGLDHPNIVKLLDGGSTPEGLPFLVMDYVEGCPIDDYCDLHKLCVDDRLKIFSNVCNAVQYAHQKGVIHRDLKPGNILVASDASPRLLDFGIAKVLNSEPTSQFLLATQTGSRCMTPAYASPEQMRGKAVTHATDIYSLGVVLYELLSGHRPYRLTQRTPAEIERAICEQDPETPSTAVFRVETDTTSDGLPITLTPETVSQTREGQPERLRRKLRGDLDKIVLKALQKEPEHRYGSVENLTQDIQRHLQHLPVKARLATPSYRASKFLLRHKAATAVVVGLFAIFAAVSMAVNAGGVRTRFFGAGSFALSKSAGIIPSPHPKGWVTAGATTAKAVVPCESLANLSQPDLTVTSARSIPAGSFSPPASDPISNLPAFCRFEGTIKPSADSDIHFEVWMPSSGWNGKFVGVGNGGFGGAINYEEMAPMVRNGYAAASTDTGHVADDGDSLWALGHPEKVADFGYRAVHEMTVSSKRTIQAFYGREPSYSLFEGCSNGGRQGLMEAQRFPGDYRGILAGAPAIRIAPLLANALSLMPSNPGEKIPASKIPAIRDAVLDACDAQDGVTDGIVNDPQQCHFNPEVLLCRGSDSAHCLTAPQVAHLKRIYAGMKSANGEQLYPGYLPGGEEGEEGWAGWMSGIGQDLMAAYGANYYRDVVYGDHAWDFRTTSPQQAAAVGDSRLRGTMDASNPDLRQFRTQGGKLILYHGWSDAAMSGLATVDYYREIMATVGSRETDDFVRLYMAPGMQHCFGGPGPSSFGQIDLSAIAPNTPQSSIPHDPEHNALAALEGWVQQGVAPGSLIATKYVDDLDPSKGVKMTRPLCPYPQTATYKGTGNTNDAVNFVCSTVNK